MRLIFIFVDGVGLGKQHPDNPFFYNETPGLSGLLAGNNLTVDFVNYVGPRASLLGLDATLGVEGLPQSATGQASIFTGVNAAALRGRHLRGFPDNLLRRLIADKSLFKHLRSRGFQPAFANAYRPQFFESLRRRLPGSRYSCSTLTAYYGGLHFYNLEDVKAGKTLYMDITNEILQRMDYDVPLINPEEGADRLIKLSRHFDFCLFEYFLSDLAGHLADHSEADHIVGILDQFVGALASQINPKEELLLITSDHGNLEDLTRRDHTLNQVPVLLVGDLNLRRHIHSGLNDLTDLFPAVQSVLNWKGSDEQLFKKRIN